MRFSAIWVSNFSCSFGNFARSGNLTAQDGPDRKQEAALAEKGRG